MSKNVGKKTQDDLEVLEDVTEYAKDCLVGSKAGSRGFQCRLDTSKVCKVNVWGTASPGKPPHYQ